MPDRWQTVDDLSPLSGHDGLVKRGRGCLRSHVARIEKTSTMERKASYEAWAVAAISPASDRLHAEARQPRQTIPALVEGPAQRGDRGTGRLPNATVHPPERRRDRRPSIRALRNDLYRPRGGRVN